MAEPLQRFDLRAGFNPPAASNTDTGAAALFAHIADVSGRLTQQISQMADRAAIKDGQLRGLDYGGNAGLPEATMPAVNEAAGSPGAAAAGSPEETPPRTGGGPDIARQTGGSLATAIHQSAAQLGVDPVDLATAISYETGGRFSPSIRGGKNNAYIGLIQFGPAEQQSYGASQGQSGAQQMQAVTRYLKDRGLKPGMGLLDIYSTINAGSPGHYTASDQPGMTVASHVAAMAPHRRNALRLLSGAQPGQSSPVVAPAGAAGVMARPAAPPFQLTRSWTLRGEAYDRAAVQVYSDRLETKTLGDLEQIGAATPDDPAATAQAIEQYRKEVRPQLVAELRGPFDALVQRHAIAYTQTASRLHAAKLADENEAAFLETYQAKRRAIVQMAGRASPDQAGNAALAGELQSLHDFVSGAQELSPKERVKFNAELTDDVMTARLLGYFESRGTPEARAKFAEFLGQAYNQGEGLAKEMSPEAFSRVQSAMQGVLNRDQVEQLKQASAVSHEVDQTMARLKAGYAIPEAERASLKARVAANGDPMLAQDWGVFEGLANWQTVNRQSPPQAIGQQVAAYEAEVARRGATANDVAALDVMRGLYKATADGVSKDPLGWAEQAGLIKLSPLDGSSPEALQATLTTRAAEARAVAGHYGIAPQFFRPEEAQAIAKMVADNPDSLVTLGKTLGASLMDRDMPLALAQISKDAPVVAHAVGVAQETGEDGLLKDVATSLKLRQVEGYEPIDVPKAVKSVAIPALSLLPRAEASTRQVAQLLYERAARQEGLDPKADPEGARAIWARSLNEALGAHEVNGRTLGGVGDINGIQTLIPSDMTASDLQDRLDGLRDSDMARLPAIDPGNGFDISADNIALGHLVAAGPGRYRVALGDPAGPDPSWVMAKGGGFWEISADQLPVPLASGAGTRSGGRYGMPR